MSDRAPAALHDLALGLQRARVPGLVDVYLERVSEASWRLEGGRVRASEVLLREGAAVRRPGSLESADGLERAVLAGLLDVPAGALPPFSAAPFARPPAAEEVLDRLGSLDGVVRWRESWGAVLRGGRAVELVRPALVEVAVAGGRRRLATWPPEPALAEPEDPAAAGSPPRPGPTTALLAPAAAAVLGHELFGHPLEADLLVRGASPWSGLLGARVLALDLDLDDDPTAAGLPGSFSADDEGTPGVCRPLLRAGRLEGVLADREHAAALGVPAGNARRASVHAFPRPRVSNLVLRSRNGAGMPPREEARLEVTSFSAGTIEPRSRQVFLSVRRAYTLRRGERQRALGPFTLVGGVQALCDGVLAAGGVPEACGEPGWCGKDGETVPTGAVAPWLLVTGWEVR